jgi:hypothetical protein
MIVSRFPACLAVSVGLCIGYAHAFRPLIACVAMVVCSPSSRLIPLIPAYRALWVSQYALCLRLSCVSLSDVWVWVGCLVFFCSLFVTSFTLFLLCSHFLLNRVPEYSVHSLGIRPFQVYIPLFSSISSYFHLPCLGSSNSNNQ